MKILCSLLHQVTQTFTLRSMARRLCQYANQGKDAAFLSDALSIELPSDAARALSVKIAKPRHCCTIGEAYPSSAVSIEFPVETAKLYLS